MTSAPYFKNHLCMFSGKRQQLNAITAFIDASNVYGSSEEEMNHLRELSPSEAICQSWRLYCYLKYYNIFLARQ